MQAPNSASVDFPSDKELIQTHLYNVLRVLRAAPTDELSVAQANSRIQMINWLDGYRAAGNFPMNYYRPERIPVFIDEHGTHCAVGYLMMMSGHDEMAWRISRADNYVWVKDLKDAGVPAWQQASGLSFEELALIQGAYDWYPENSYYLANRFETPQQPKCTTAYFGSPGRQGMMKTKNVWCKGEGTDGVLNGKWEQNYSAGIPWIEGYYKDGKRTGQWKEYYPGTTLLVRTERWENDKLNGTRTRYDRQGRIIEEILFEDGVAVSKINYDLTDSLAYVRVPLDSTTVMTTVFDKDGKLIAAGKEIVHNPGGLKWFQNIELTALNSAQITTQHIQSGENGNGLNSNGGYFGTNPGWDPPLVEYKKTGEWIYLKDTTSKLYAWHQHYKSIPLANALIRDYHHFGYEMYSQVTMFKLEPTNGYDSIHVVYDNNHIVEFCGYSKTNYAHLHLDYYYQPTWRYEPVLHISGLQLISGSGYQTRYVQDDYATVKETGQYNQFGQRIGEWKYYNQNGTMYKTETYHIPTNEDENLSAGL